MSLNKMDLYSKSCTNVYIYFNTTMLAYDIIYIIYKSCIYIYFNTRVLVYVERMLCTGHS